MCKEYGISLKFENLGNYQDLYNMINVLLLKALNMHKKFDY